MHAELGLQTAELVVRLITIAGSTLPHAGATCVDISTYSQTHKTQETFHGRSCACVHACFCTSSLELGESIPENCRAVNASIKGLCLAGQEKSKKALTRPGLLAYYAHTETSPVGAVFP